jgi:hypothetical protein
MFLYDLQVNNPKGQSWMYNPEKLVTLSTKDIWRRLTKQNTENKKDERHRAHHRKWTHVLAKGKQFLLLIKTGNEVDFILIFKSSILFQTSNGKKVNMLWNKKSQYLSFEKSLNISKSSPKAVNKMTDNTMAKRKKPKTLSKKLSIGQHESH